MDATPRTGRREEAKKAVGSAVKKGKRAVKEIGHQTQEIVAEARVTAAPATETATRETVDALKRQKSAAASGMERVQKTLENASARLHAEDSPLVAAVTDLAATRLTRLSRYVERRSLRELAADAGELARTRPEVLFGGLLVAGVATGRVLKSWSRRRGTAD